MPMSRLLAGSRVMSLPPTVIWPLSASSRPASSRSVVVLPQPDGPSSATSSPGWTVRSSPSSATTGPYCRRSPSIRTSTAVLVASAAVSVTGERHVVHLIGRPRRAAADVGQDQQQDEGEQQRGGRGREEHARIRRAPADSNSVTCRLTYSSR